MGPPCVEVCVVRRQRDDPGVSPMTLRLLAIATLALLGYVGATWWSFRVTGHPEPDPYAEPFGDV